MGNNNVSRVLLSGKPKKLNHAPYLCLLLMAKAAHDSTGQYWRGHSWLVLMMGYQQMGDSGYREVRRHIRVLERHGYVSVIGGEPGSRITYQLHLPGLSTGPDRPRGDSPLGGEGGNTPRT